MIFLGTFLASVLLIFFVAKTCPVRGFGRWCAPEMLALLALLAIFAVRPLFEDRFVTHDFYGVIPSDRSIHEARIVGWAGITLFVLGVLLCSLNSARASEGKNLSRSRYFSWLDWPSKNILIVALASSPILGLVPVLLAGGPSSLSLLFAGRSRELSSLISGMPEIVSFTPISGPFILALYLASGKKFGSKYFLCFLVTPLYALNLWILSQGGNRRIIIAAVLAPAIAFVWSRRPKVGLIGVALTSILVIALAVFPFVRSQGARRPGENMLDATFRYLSEEGLYSVIREPFVSFDTEMLDVVATFLDAQKVTNYEFGFGKAVLLEFIARPLPSSNYMGYYDKFLSDTFGGDCATAFCPVPSVIGISYMEAGFLGLMLFMPAFGWWSRSISHSICRKPPSPLFGLYVITCATYIPISTRTHTVHAMWWGIYAASVTLVIWLVLQIFLGSESSDEKPCNDRVLG